MSKTSKFVSTLFASTLFATSALASSDIMFILDGSGSMWGKLEGAAKIKTAKTAMVKMLDDVPQSARLGLMTYGTKNKESCEDVTQLNALGSDRGAIKASIEGLKPLGKTPIDLALSKGLATIGAQSGDVPRSIVLVSDGIETCNGDPCGVAKAAKLRGIDMKIHVVGFNVDAEARTQLECIAKEGGGQYFDAANTEGFQQAIDQVVQVAQAEPEPVAEEPSGPTITEFFRDDFDGTELAEHWAVENANLDNFVVDAGALTMLSTKQGGFENENPENLIVYTGELPKGDWDAEITFTGELSSSANRLLFGLRKDENNFLASGFHGTAGTICLSTDISNNKVSNGEAEQVTIKYRGTPASIGNCYVRLPLGNEPWEKIVAEHVDTPTTLTLSKRGRSYTVKSGMAGKTLEDGSPYVVETTQFTSLRSPGTLAFTIDRHGRGATGEVLMNIDSVVINKVEQ